MAKDQKVNSLGFLSAYEPPKQGIYCTTAEEETSKLIKISEKVQRIKDYDK